MKSRPAGIPSPDAGSGDSAGGDSYFGGKGSSFRHLVNQIPPIATFVSAFAGRCAIVRNMKLPDAVLLIDKNLDVVRWWERHLEKTPPNSGSVHSIRRACGIKLLSSPKLATLDPATTFVYLDPPYPLSTRKSGTRYQNEMTDADHRTMLQAAKELKCMVMISSYDSDLYRKQLSSWRHFSFRATTRSGTAVEHVWCNYPQPVELQDYRWLGKDKRERFKLLRREQNLINKLNRLSDIERNALLAAIVSHFGDGIRK